MAKTLTGNPWIFTAAGDAEGQGMGGVYDLPIYIDQIKLDTGDGGDFELLDAEGGTSILKLDSTPANDTLWIPIGHYQDSVYVGTLADNASIYLYHGRKDA